MKLLTLLFLIFTLIPDFLFSQFVQQGPKLVGTGTNGNTVYQGRSVAISSDGNTAVIGGQRDNNFMGAIWIFTRNGDTWVQQGQKLVGTGSIGSLVAQGSSVAISSDGNTIIEGAYGDNYNVGAVWIFTRTAGVWTQQSQKIVGNDISQETSYQGYSVAISSDGNTAIVGGYRDNSYQGACWVFTRNGGIWSQQGQKLVGSGGSITSYQGASVSISSDGNTAIEGADYDDDHIGACWIFTRTGNMWSQQGPKLVGTGAAGNALQGVSVAISSDGNTALVGGYQDNGNAGATWVFVRSSNVWTQQGTKLFGSGAIGNSEQGISVAISSDGNTAFIGGFADNGFIGATWIFSRNNGLWIQQGSKLVGNNNIGNSHQGVFIAISSSGNTLIVGGEADNGGLGAAWVFHNPTIGISPLFGEIPKNFSLSQNYPNPFNPSTKIRFEIPVHNSDAQTFLSVYDILGRKITTLINESHQPGTYEVNFDGSNLPSGIYFYTLVTGDFNQTRKMILLK